jgi:hypothetical protein
MKPDDPMTSTFIAVGSSFSSDLQNQYLSLTRERLGRA